MYESYIWPGAYSFKTEIKMFVKWIKGRVDSLLNKIETAEKKL